MNATHLLSTATTRARELARLARDVVPHVPLLRRKPAIALFTLTSARRAHVLLIVATVTMLFIVGPMVRATLQKTYPEKGALFGLVKKQDARIQETQRTITRVLWLGTAGTALLLLWLHIPAAVTQAGARAKRNEERADRLRNERPHHSLLLYRRALALASDPDHEGQLHAKIASLSTSEAATATAGGTAVLEPRTTGGPAVAAHRSGASNVDSSARYADLNRRYEIVSELGQGNMGVVFDSVDHVLDRPVALKQLPAWLATEADFVARFQQEARALARLSHPHIVQVYDFFEANGRIFMVLERVAGGDLARKIERHGRHEVAAATNLAAKMAGALGYAHDQGIVHRDLKPSNVLLTEDGVPKVTDFGLAKIARASTLTQEGAILGSPLYMSPEQAAGRPADARSDIYALGITLYELLTGQTPFTGDTAQVLAQHITQPPPTPRALNPDVPLELERHLLSMLAKDPDGRPRSMQDVARGLAPFVPIARPATA